MARLGLAVHVDHTCTPDSPVLVVSELHRERRGSGERIGIQEQQAAAVVGGDDHVAQDVLAVLQRMPLGPPPGHDLPQAPAGEAEADPA